MIDYFSFVDFISPPVLLIIIYLIAKRRQLREIESNPSYKYYLWGLFAKIFGGISVCFIYVFYYGNGDTMNYYNDNIVLINLFQKSFSSGMSYILSHPPELWYSFDQDTGFPTYFSDPKATMVVRLTWWMSLISLKSFIGTTIILAWISYYPIWRLYQTLVKEFPSLSKQFAFSLLFIPSVIFWGSGLLKDTITFSAVCLFASSYSIMLIQKRNVFKNLLLLVLAAYLLISIKPYIFFALLPGSVLWFGGIQISKLKNKLVRSMTAPFLIIVSLISGYIMLSLMGNFLGDYAIENVLDKAIVTQQDLKNDRYQGSSWDIGEFDPTFSGILSKAPLAINAALFRPYIWECSNPAMMMSGIENMILLIFTIFLLIKLRVYNVFRLMFRHRILFFTVFFSLFFAFSVGLTTSNFGSLVRYKIPAIPFFVLSLFIIKATFVDLRREDAEKMLVTTEQQPSVA